MEKSYKVRFSPSVDKFMEWLGERDFELFSRIHRVLKQLQFDPYAGKALGGKGRGRYSCRVGSYRIIYELIKEHLVVHVIDIGHRREVYRKFN